MIELPETYVLSKQINQQLVGKTIKNVMVNVHPHAFAWFTDDLLSYQDKLAGKKVTNSNPGTGYTCGGNTEILCEDMLLVISTPIKYHSPGAKLPAKHQLLIEFEDGSHMSCTVQMWGAMFCFAANEDGIPKDYAIKKCPTPYEDAFNKAYFDSLLNGLKPTISAKAFLATEQRIPGFGNGVLHDVLWNARIHPKRKLKTLNDGDIENMFNSVKSTLLQMRDEGGRDTEKDLFNQKGGYRTILSNKTLIHPCTACGSGLVRESYMGGNIYFCPVCQPL